MLKSGVGSLGVEAGIAAGAVRSSDSGDSVVRSGDESCACNTRRVSAS